MADNDKITELANRIYALDEKVYKATGSNLGRVYQGNKEKCINDLRDLLKSSADSSVLRSELALISNMARTTKKNPQLHKEIMHEYGEIFDEAMAMQEAREEMILLTRSMQSLTCPILQTDLERTTILLYA